MTLRFSQRYGYKNVRTTFQLDDMDVELRNSLWNTLHTHFWYSVDDSAYLKSKSNLMLYRLLNKIWVEFFKLPLDEMPLMWEYNRKVLKNNFFSANWYEVYDFIEFVATVRKSDSFKLECNKVFESEMSAYRFVGDYIAPIIDEVEINEIESALDNNHLQYVSVHLANSLDLLSDRHNPDYRNSVKESISAVEGVAKLISGDAKAELSAALKKLETELAVELHGALREGFKKIYGYTSDGDGIRHSLTDAHNVSFEDAKFMLVACSAFVNYLIAKSEKAGINLDN